MVPMFKRAARNNQGHGHPGREADETLSPRERVQRDAEERIRAAQQKFLLETELRKARENQNGRVILALEASIAGEHLPKKLKRHIRNLQNPTDGIAENPGSAGKPGKKPTRPRHPRSR